MLTPWLSQYGTPFLLPSGRPSTPVRSPGRGTRAAYASAAGVVASNGGSMRATVDRLGPEERQLVGWFRYQRRMGRLPAGPFWLRPGVHVCFPERLYDHLERDCAEPAVGWHDRRLWLENLRALRRAVEHPIGPPPVDGVDGYNRKGGGAGPRRPSTRGRTRD